jgi:flagellin
VDDKARRRYKLWQLASTTIQRIRTRKIAMAMTINTNVVSINAQRNLSLSGSQLGTAMQRLSSGLRVNSAKDDAAGLAIAERMNAQSKGLAVAARNANDGISLAQTAEGALGKVGDMLQRMRELAVQASNATNSSTDREALQAEVSQLTAEIDRVAKTSSFNGQKLLEGSFAGAVFQVGAGAGDNITVGSLVNAKASELSNVTYETKSFEAIDVSAAATYAATAAGMTMTVDGELYTLDVLKAASSSTERLGQIAAAINAKTADSGVTAYLAKADDGTYTLELMSDKAITAGAGLAAAVTSEGGVVLQAGAVPANIADADVVSAAGTDVKGIATVDVSTQSGAWLALKKVDSAIDQINSSRADLGALQTRFEKSIENIDIMNENISAARGRIVDADFAAETASLSRTQILQQAGTAMVAQANQLSQGVLSLLQ